MGVIPRLPSDHCHEEKAQRGKVTGESDARFSDFNRRRLKSQFNKRRVSYSRRFTSFNFTFIFQTQIIAALVLTGPHFTKKQDEGEFELTLNYSK